MVFLVLEILALKTIRKQTKHVKVICWNATKSGTTQHTLSQNTFMSARSNRGLLECPFSLSSYFQSSWLPVFLWYVISIIVSLVFCGGLQVAKTFEFDWFLFCMKLWHSVLLQSTAHIMLFQNLLSGYWLIPKYSYRPNRRVVLNTHVGRTVLLKD